MQDFGYHKKEEFCCPCCKLFGIAEESLRKFLEAEKLSGMIFEIQQAYRCPDYNKKLGKGERSSHLTGNAFNIFCYDLKNHKKIFSKRKAFLIIESCMKVGFTRIGINFKDCYIHVDDDNLKRNKVLFGY